MSNRITIAQIAEGLWAPSEFFDFDRVWVGEERAWGPDLVTGWMLLFGRCVELEATWVATVGSDFRTRQECLPRFEAAMELRREVLNADAKSLPAITEKMQTQLEGVKNEIYECRRRPLGSQPPGVDFFLARLDWIHTEITNILTHPVNEQIHSLLVNAHLCWREASQVRERREKLSMRKYDEVHFHTNQLDIVWAIVWKSNSGWNNYEANSDDANDLLARVKRFSTRK